MKTISRPRSQRTGRLLQALLDGGQMETLVSQMKTEEERKRQLTVPLARLDGLARLTEIDRQRLHRQLTGT